MERLVLPDSLKSLMMTTRVIYYGMFVFTIATLGDTVFTLYFGPRLPAQVEREHVILDATVLGALYAIVAITFAWHQVRLMVWQAFLQEKRDNEGNHERLINAVEALTEELKRRPEPVPSVINFSLFGKK
jgi:hypothetical protein